MTTPNAPSEMVRGDRHVPEADLKAYADGELGGWGRLSARRHLARCSACREEIERMERLTQNLRTSEAAEPLNVALRARLIAAAANTPVAAPAEAFSSSPLWRRQPLLTLGASGAVAAVALYLVALPRPVFAPERRGAAETASATASAPAGASAGAGNAIAFKDARPAAAAAAPPAGRVASVKAATVEKREDAMRPSGHAKSVAAPPPPSVARERSVAAGRTAPRFAQVTQDADGSAARAKRDAVLLKDAPAATQPTVRVPLAAAAPPPTVEAGAVAGGVSAPAPAGGSRSGLSSGVPMPRERIAVVPPREVVLAVAPGQSAATREAVLSLVRSAGGSFEERRGPSEAALGLDAADRRLDVRVAPDRMETLLADVARLNVQAAPEKGRAGAVPTATQARSVADANSGRGAAKPAPAAAGAPALNSGGGFGGGAPAPGRTLNYTVRNQAAAAQRKEQRAVPARAAVTIRIVEEAKAVSPAPAAPAAPNNGGRQSP